MIVPEDLLYTESHEWVQVKGKVVTVGVTDYAVGELGDITYLELPEEGDQVAKDDSFGVIESVKAVSDLIAPVSGRIVKVNSELSDTLDTVTRDPYKAGWMVQMEMDDPSELEELLTAAQYRAKLEEEKEE